MNPKPWQQFYANVTNHRLWPEQRQYECLAIKVGINRRRLLPFLVITIGARNFTLGWLWDEQS